MLFRKGQICGTIYSIVGSGVFEYGFVRVIRGLLGNCHNTKLVSIVSNDTMLKQPFLQMQKTNSHQSTAYSTPMFYSLTIPLQEFVADQ
jgi:hypothetical protein